MNLGHFFCFVVFFSDTHTQREQFNTFLFVLLQICGQFLWRCQKLFFVRFENNPLNIKVVSELQKKKENRESDIQVKLGKDRKQSEAENNFSGLCSQHGRGRFLGGLA